MKVKIFFSAEMKLLQLLLHKSKLNQIVTGIFYIIVVYEYKRMNNKNRG